MDNPNQNPDQSPNPEGGAPVDAAPGAESGPETLDSLREQLAAARVEADEQLRGWQRAQADYTNFRRRVEQEREKFVRYAETGIIRDLLPILDDLDRALANLPAELREVTWVEGVSLIERKMRSLLEQHGLKSIEALGKDFDPHEHEAVMRDGEPGEATVVTGELQRGYRLHDRILRPTLVRVGQPAGSK